MNFIKRSDDVLKVLEHVIRMDFFERVIAERPGPAIQVVYDISTDSVANIEVRRTREMSVAASDIKADVC